MSTLNTIKMMIMKGEIVSSRVLHQVNILERYIDNNGGGMELITEISDNAIFFYSNSKAEYLLKIDMSNINEGNGDDE